jgi:hypothetical protein
VRLTTTNRKKKFVAKPQQKKRESQGLPRAVEPMMMMMMMMMIDAQQLLEIFLNGLYPKYTGLEIFFLLHKEYSTILPFLKPTVFKIMVVLNMNLKYFKNVISCIFKLI